MSSGGTTWSFTYDADGMRTKRTNGSTTYSYVYNGGSLSYMGVGGNNLYFTYDASGSPVSVKYNGTNYYYVTNLQGDVTAILNSSGTTVVAYTYDAWGRLLTTTGSMASTLGSHNPLRYRGYVYDTETGLYYLQSRYYNPTIGRFLNADVFISTGQGLLGNNMFAYCGNNPVNCNDADGLYTRGQIHNFVLEQIILYMQKMGRVTLSMSDTTIYYNGYNWLGGWDFCDLYDVKTHEVWELKRITCSKEKAESQLNNYVKGKLKYQLEFDLKVGGELFQGEHSFTVSDDNGTYHISFKQGENGIIWYDYTYTKSDLKKVSEALAFGGLATGAGVLAVGLLTKNNVSEVMYSNAA